MGDSAFELRQWANVTPAAGWSFAAGNVTGSDRTDAIGYHPSNGTIWVGTNSGSAFTFALWATMSPAAGWTFVAGRFTGGDRDDVVGYHAPTGTLWLGRNTGAAFVFEAWGTVAPATGWSFVAGDLDSDGLTDLVGYHPSNGTLWAGLNTGSGFAFTRWATVQPAAGWTFHAGDFLGHGRVDLFGYHPGNGSLWVGENSGHDLTFRQWGGPLSPAADWRFAAGYFRGRGKCDVAAYHPSNGTLWVGQNMGDRFAFEHAGTLSPIAGWTFAAGMFTADGVSDLLGYQASDGGIWVARSQCLAIEGYCWPLSGAPGDTLDFHISGEGRSSLVYMRHFADALGVRSLTAGRTTFEPAPQEMPVEAWKNGCGWPSSVSLTIPDDWRSGLYSARAVDGDGDECHITFVVRPRADARSQVAVLANANTWLAYNGWGGQSKYDLRTPVSFLRPNPNASPVGTGSGALHLTRGELWILGWLEREGYAPDVYTDIDFHNGLVTSDYKVLVFGTHPEYWTTGMYDRMVEYLQAGGSVFYLGGNGVYEAGEYIDDQTRMTFLAGVDHGPREPAMFRRLSPPRPERAVLGVATERCGALGTPYRVLDATHPLFAGTDLRNGDAFGDVGLNTGYGNGKASAWEVDTADGPGALGIAIACGHTSVPVPPSTLPANLAVLARADADAGGRGAELVFSEHPGGGIVLSAGSITFGGSLIVDRALQQILRNALARIGVGS